MNEQSTVDNNFIKYIVIFIAIIIVALGVLIIFFTDYILNAKNTVKKQMSKIYYFKWLIVGFILNILFLLGIFTMKSYKNNIKGEQGPQGFIGKKGVPGNNCVLCVEDEPFKYDLKYKFNQNNIWNK